MATEDDRGPSSLSSASVTTASSSATATAASLISSSSPSPSPSSSSSLNKQQQSQSPADDYLNNLPRVIVFGLEALWGPAFEKGEFGWEGPPFHDPRGNGEYLVDTQSEAELMNSYWYYEGDHRSNDAEAAERAAAERLEEGEELHDDGDAEVSAEDGDDASAAERRTERGERPDHPVPGGSPPASPQHAKQQQQQQSGQQPVVDANGRMRREEYMYKPYGNDGSSGGKGISSGGGSGGSAGVGAFSGDDTTNEDEEEEEEAGGGVVDGLRLHLLEDSKRILEHIVATEAYRTKQVQIFLVAPKMLKKHERWVYQCLGKLKLSVGGGGGGHGSNNKKDGDDDESDSSIESPPSASASSSSSSVVPLIDIFQGIDFSKGTPRQKLQSIQRQASSGVSLTGNSGGALLARGSITGPSSSQRAASAATTNYNHRSKADRKQGVDFTDMIWFDADMSRIDCQRLGVFCVWSVGGITERAFAEQLEARKAFIDLEATGEKMSLYTIATKQDRGELTPPPDSYFDEYGNRIRGTSAPANLDPLVAERLAKRVEARNLNIGREDSISTRFFQSMAAQQQQQKQKQKQQKHHRRTTKGKATSTNKKNRGHAGGDKREEEEADILRNFPLFQGSSSRSSSGNGGDGALGTRNEEEALLVDGKEDDGDGDGDSRSIIRTVGTTTTKEDASQSPILTGDGGKSGDGDGDNKKLATVKEESSSSSVDHRGGGGDDASSVQQQQRTKKTRTTKKVFSAAERDALFAGLDLDDVGTADTNDDGDDDDSSSTRQQDDQGRGGGGGGEESLEDRDRHRRRLSLRNEPKTGDGHQEDRRTPILAREKSREEEAEFYTNYQIIKQQNAEVDPFDLVKELNQQLDAWEEGNVDPTGYDDHERDERMLAADQRRRRQQMKDETLKKSKSDDVNNNNRRRAPRISPSSRIISAATTGREGNDMMDMVVAPLAFMTFILPLTALLHAISSQRHRRGHGHRSGSGGINKNKKKDRRRRTTA